MHKAPRILSLSQYGADLAKGSAFSGALDRQRDYAGDTSAYVVLVPFSPGAVRVEEGALSILPVGEGGLVSFMLAAYRTAHLLHTEQPFDALMVDNPHVMGVMGVVVARRLGIPLVIHQMADMFENPQYLRERRSNSVKYLMMRFAIPRARLVRVSTAYEVRRLVHAGVPAERIVQVPFYIDHDVFQTSLASVRRERGEAGRILYVGRLGPQKDVATLIRAVPRVIAAVPHARIVVVGDGPERSMLEVLARQLHVAHAIEFTGAIPRERVAAEFARASLFALPSLYEGTCMVIHEAALAGLPIVSTLHAGAHDFIRDGSEGALVRVRDHRALGDALATLAQAPAECRRRGDAARERVRTRTRAEALSAWRHLLDLLQV